MATQAISGEFGPAAQATSGYVDVSAAGEKMGVRFTPTYSDMVW